MVNLILRIAAPGAQIQAGKSVRGKPSTKADFRRRKLKREELILKQMVQVVVLEKLF